MGEANQVRNLVVHIKNLYDTNGDNIFWNPGGYGLRVLDERIIETRRWSYVSEVVFTSDDFEDQYVRVTYHSPATEMQEFDDMDEPIFEQVIPISKTVTIYETI